MRHEIGPVLRGGIVGGCGDDLVVFRTIGIGADIEQAGPLLDLIFAIRQARRDQAWLAALFGIDQPDFTGLVVMRVDDDEFVRERLAHADKEAGVLFFVDDRIGRLFGADIVPANTERAVVVVIFGIVDRRAVIGPDIGAGSLADGFGTVLAGGEIAQHDIVIFRAGPVGGPGQRLVRRIVAGAGKAEIIVAGLDIAVEQYGFRAPIA